MSDDAENHTLRLLREMRDDNRAMRDEMGAMRREMRDGFESMQTQINGVTHILTMLAGHAHDLEERVTTLEGASDGGA